MSRIGRELQITLQTAYREAVARRHPYLTVEHLLYALLHTEAGADALAHAGADVDRLRAELERFFDRDLEAVPGDDPVEAQQTLAFHRVLQHAVDHCEGAEKDEVELTDLLVAIYQEPDSFAVTLLRGQQVTRLDLLQWISHGVSKRRDGADAGEGDAAALFGRADEDGEVPSDPLAAFTTNLSAKAAAGELDPLIGRGRELDRTLHILARRRKNNPIFVGETGVGKTALAEGLALRIHEGRVPDDLRASEIFSLDLGALLAGTRYRGDFEARFKALTNALQIKGDRPHIVMFLTDGQPSFPYGSGAVSDRQDVEAAIDAARLADKASVVVNTYALGRQALARPVAATEMARITSGTYTAVRNPGDIVHFLKGISFANVDDVLIANRTLREVSVDVSLAPDGSFSGLVPARPGANELEVTALASDGREASAVLEIEFAEATLGARELERELARIRQRNKELLRLLERERIERFRARRREVVIGEDAEGDTSAPSERAAPPPPDSGRD